MGFAPSLLILGLSIVVMTIGSSLYSGTMEALVYDSLKEHQQEGIYDKIISNINSLKFIALAASGIIGGFFYSVSPGLPFISVGIVIYFGLLVTLFLHEPLVDTEQFSLKSYIHQTRQGFHQLPKSKQIKEHTVLLLCIGIFIMIIYQVLNDVLVVEFGFKAQQLGILVAITCFVSAIASQLTPKITRIAGEVRGLLIISFLIGLSLLTSPFVGVALGGLSVIFRASLHANYDNITSVILNRNTESKYRATTLSTFNMLSKIPYVLVAYFVGYLMDVYTAVNFSFMLGGMLLLSMGFLMLRFNLFSGSKFAKGS